MKKSKKFTKTIRKAVIILSMILCPLAFLGTISINDASPNWWKLLLIFAGTFVLSVILFVTCSDPNSLFKRVFGITACIMSFAYRHLKIRNRFTKKFNMMWNKQEGYIGLYLTALDEYNDYIRTDFDI